MNRFNIIIPLLNEIKEVSRFESLAEQFAAHNLIFCDSGSSDGTAEAIKSLKESYPQITLNFAKLESPSVLKTIELAYPNCTEEYTLIHPVDMDLNGNLELAEISELSKTAAFYKTYAPSNWLLFLQSLFLNFIDLKMRSNFVWTNNPIIKTHILKTFKPKTYGFLEDVQLSDYLKSRYKLQVINSPIIASSRRYVEKGTIRRFIKNAFIMLMFRTGVMSISKLKSIYYK